jgi:transcriptional regulator of acetoin/glycerol metabolism
MCLGGDNFIPVDVRVIAATNRNPADLINGGELHQDLYNIDRGTLYRKLRKYSRQVKMSYSSKLNTKGLH